MTNDSFIYDLEYKLNFGNFWCDGIYPLYEPKELSKIINDKRILEMNIDYGETGQESYKLILHFGNKSVSRNARGLDLSLCLPDFIEEPDSILIDRENKIVEILLK